MIEEPLQLPTRERPRLRIPLVVVEVHDRVPLMTDRHRMDTRPEPLLTLPRPPVSGIAQVLAEQPHDRLIATNRRRRQTPLTGHPQRPLLDMPRQPIPRVLIGEPEKPTHHTLTRRDRGVGQPPRGLLGPPATQHRLHQRVLRMKLHNPRHQFEPRRARQISPDHPTSSPTIGTPSMRGSCIKRSRQAIVAGRFPARGRRKFPLPPLDRQATCQDSTARCNSRKSPQPCLRARTGHRGTVAGRRGRAGGAAVLETGTTQRPAGHPGSDEPRPAHGPVARTSAERAWPRRAEGSGCGTVAGRVASNPGMTHAHRRSASPLAPAPDDSCHTYHRRHDHQFHADHVAEVAAWREWVARRPGRWRRAGIRRWPG